jgi:hypothetical protein
MERNWSRLKLGLLEFLKLEISLLLDMVRKEQLEWSIDKRICHIILKG